MHDIKEIEANPEEYKRRLALRHDKTKPEDKIDEVLDLNAHRKILIAALEINLARLNVISEDIAMAKRAKQPIEPFLNEAAIIKVEVPIQKQALKEVEDKIWQILAVLPNLPRLDVPDGNGEDDNVVLKVWNPPDAVDEIMTIIRDFVDTDLSGAVKKAIEEINQIDQEIDGLNQNFDIQ